MVLFARNVKKTEGAADKNGDVDGMCKQTLNTMHSRSTKSVGSKWGTYVEYLMRNTWD